MGAISPERVIRQSHPIKTRKARMTDSFLYVITSSTRYFIMTSVTRKRCTTRMPGEIIFTDSSLSQANRTMLKKSLIKMVKEQNVKGADGDLIVGTADQVIINRQLKKETAPAILDDRITDKKDCGEFSHCNGCKLWNL